MYWQAVLLLPVETSSELDNEAIDRMVAALQPYPSMLFICVANQPAQCGVFAFQPGVSAWRQVRWERLSGR